MTLSLRDATRAVASVVSASGVAGDGLPPRDAVAKPLPHCRADPPRCRSLPISF